MKITSETNLRDFNFWSGAKENAEDLTINQLDQIEEILSELYPNGMTETKINDLFWFEFDTVKEWLGIEDDEDNEDEYE